MSWIDMRARKPTEQDALMEAGGDLAVEVLCRHEHGYYPMIVTLKQIAEAEERAGKYYPLRCREAWSPGTSITGMEETGRVDNLQKKESPCDGAFLIGAERNTGL